MYGAELRRFSTIPIRFTYTTKLMTNQDNDSTFYRQYNISRALLPTVTGMVGSFCRPSQVLKNWMGILQKSNRQIADEQKLRIQKKIMSLHCIGMIVGTYEWFAYVFHCYYSPPVFQYSDICIHACNEIVYLCIFKTCELLFMRNREEHREIPSDSLA